MFKKKEFLVHQYKDLLLLPKELRKYWIEYDRSNLYFNGFFNICGNEVLVKENDYLVLDNGRLYYYPKEVYETKANKNIVGRKENI